MTVIESRLLKRRGFLIGAIGMALMPLQVTAALKPKAITVWKDPNCGCCGDWVMHLEANGFKVETIDQGNAAARAKLGMPEKFGSCHTALINGYVIEGHVPAADIHRLLKESPDPSHALGLSVPGMPIGSPGMDGPAYGGRQDAYQVLLVNRDGTAKVFNRYG